MTPGPGKITSLNYCHQAIFEDSQLALALLKTLPKKFPEKPIKFYMDEIDQNEISQHITKIFNYKKTQSAPKNISERFAQINFNRILKGYIHTVKELEKIKMVIDRSLTSPIISSNSTSIPKEIYLPPRQDQISNKDNGFTMLDTTSKEY